MSSNKKNEKSPSLEDEIRRGRKFNLADAIGRAGAGNLKGASPVPLSRQALMDLEAMLEAHLHDPEGSLKSTLLTRLGQDLPLLDKHRDEPAGALRQLVEELLSSDNALQTLVRDTDSRWGREFQERPHFNIPGRPQSPDDPYTPEGVRSALVDLMGRI